jgi:beta-phosphoglucomutase-like phosphatase (HAD superfamily)
LPTATLFDFDGVLVDSEPVHLAAFNDVLGRRGIVISEPEYLDRYFALDDAGVFREALTRAGTPPHEDAVRELVAEKAPRFLARFADAFRVFPGAVGLVERRAARGPIGIVSGALREEIEFALGRMGVRHLFSFVVSAGDTEQSKPDPAPYRLALARLAELGHTGASLVVEDSVGGIASARAAGLRVVGVAHSYPRDALVAAGAAAVAQDLEGLTDTLLEGLA